VKVLLRAGELAVLAVLALVLPVTVRSPGVYLVCAAPCIVAFGVLAYVDGREPRR
jgi:hypothetical protein